MFFPVYQFDISQKLLQSGLLDKLLGILILALVSVCMIIFSKYRRLRKEKDQLLEKAAERSWQDEAGVLQVKRTEQQGLESPDVLFLKKAVAITEKHFGDDKFSIPAFCEEMSMSRSTLFRRLSLLTKQSPLQFIRTVQLNKAADLLRYSAANVARVSMEMGYNNPSYFARIFKKQFGVSPCKYKNQQINNNK